MENVIPGAAVTFTPLILVYQGWPYYVFRTRLGGASTTPPSASPPGPSRHA
jgi:cytochrome bd-type quinol oxidase subunit 2